VEKVLPELVVLNKEGQPETVAYHLLPVLLLNELQKEHRLNLQAKAELAAQRKTVAVLVKQSAEVGELRVEIDRLEQLTTELTTAHGNHVRAVTVARQ
jgi:tRNA G37 N-methylase Trm5